MPGTSGRRTLTTTSSPVTSRAAWTCAIEAAASGSWSIQANASSTRSSAMTRATTGHGSGVTLSCSLDSSAANSGGSRSRRVDRAWPNLVNTTPLRSSAQLSDRASEAVSGVLPLRNSGPRPARVKIRTMRQ
jgi:hypothetical protein